LALLRAAGWIYRDADFSALGDLFSVPDPAYHSKFECRILRALQRQNFVCL